MGKCYTEGQKIAFGKIDSNFISSMALPEQIIVIFKMNG